MRQVLFSNDFVRDYQGLPETIRKEAIHRMLESPRHLSLQMKKMQPKQRGIWEARVTQGYRLTFRVDGEVITMRRVGTHDLLRTP
jgi:mRNA-degrading endonuclease YafQ of YafQ-DinJ toxin-antitoxin module